jgi:uncharacterized protein (TIGR00661 family)
MNRSVIFAVQGEGRGHLTQALAMYRLLRSRGWTVSCIVVGAGARRLPAFFTDQVETPVATLYSPFFVSRDSRSVDMLRTLTANLFRLGSLFRSIRRFRRLVMRHRPDLILNFYEPLVPMAMAFTPFKGRLVSISHQNIYLHSGFSFPKEIGSKRHALTLYTRFVSLFSDLVLALSMYDLPGRREGDPVTMPPLLRGELFEKSPVTGDFYLVYLVNSGYMEDIRVWHHLHPGIRLHCFTDSEEVRSAPGGVLRIDDELSFHRLDGARFLDMMARCRGIVTTAGFETVCEAVFLGKPVVMVPVTGHLEQYCNAVDAARAGLAHRSAVFDLTLLRDLRMRLPKGNGDAFREWVLSATDRHLSEIEGLFDIGMHEAANPVFPTTRTVPGMRHVALKMLHGLRLPGF